MDKYIEIFKGSDEKIPIQYIENDEPVNLTDYEVMFVVKKEAGGESDDSDAVLSLRVTNHPDQSITENIGKTVIVIDPENTENIEKGRYIADIRVLSNTGDRIAWRGFPVQILETVGQVWEEDD